MIWVSTAAAIDSGRRARNTEIIEDASDGFGDADVKRHHYAMEGGQCFGDAQRIPESEAQTRPAGGGPAKPRRCTQWFVQYPGG
jgi:hypothetical protein